MNKACKICCIKFNSLRELSNHVRKEYKLSAKRYYDLYVKTDGDGKCLSCGAPTKFHNIGVGYRKYCCLSCSHTHKSGSNHPDWIDMDRKRTCPVCNNGFLVIPYKAKNINYCSLECYYRDLPNRISGKNHPNYKDKIRLKCANCGKEFFVHPYRIINGAKFCSRKCTQASSKTKKKKREAMLKLWKDPKHVSKMRRAISVRPTKPENMVKSLLDNTYPELFDYTGAGRKGENVGGKIPDFTSKDRQLIIEVFGVYWHTKARNQSEQRAEWDRKNHFDKYGYKTLIIWDYELDNLEKVTEKIDKFIGDENIA